MSIAKKSVLLILLILLIDQATKIYIKLNFTIGESVEVFSWFKILFIENEGMAFGLKFFGSFGKLFLTLFRIVAIGFLIYYIHWLIKKNARQNYILVISLVLAGAAGNVLDSIFYGVIFNDSYNQVASFLSADGGYAPLFFGHVVDMLYFPIIKNADGSTLFFSPVFNIADSAITVAMFVILVFFRKDLNETLESKKKQPNAQTKK